jgi:hypothetical protein
MRKQSTCMLSICGLQTCVGAGHTPRYRNLVFALGRCPVTMSTLTPLGNYGRFCHFVVLESGYLFT